VADESLYLPPRLRHSVENDGDAPLELIQVLTGDHPGDEDLAGHVPAAAAGTASV
jgi:mannose-6-phosphate isomerase-like protein (cupin superfamily)